MANARRGVSLCSTVALAVLLTANWAWPCSTFYIADPRHPVFGKNYDWDVESGLLVVNKRGVGKVAVTDTDPAEWVSIYGSVTFNQYGRELPSGGINEAGLVVELMWLDETEYAEADSRPAVDNLQWIQYELDNAATVEDVVSSDSQIRIAAGGKARIHYLVADAEGRAATIEFIGGEMVCHTGESLPWSVLTNDPYASSLEYLTGFEGFGGARQVGGGSSSLARFVRATTMIADLQDDPAGSRVDTAFDILQAVKQGSYTKWSIVYDLGDRSIYFRTLDNPAIRRVDVAAFDYACTTPSQVLDINAPLSGEVSDSFVPYSYALNRDLIETAFRGTSFLRLVPEEVLDRLARYPDSFECVDSAPSHD